MMSGQRLTDRYMAHGDGQRDEAVLNAPRSPRIGYRLAQDHAAALLGPRTLAVFGFGEERTYLPDDPRWLQVTLCPLDAPPLYETWEVDGPVTHGRVGDVRWSRGGDWLFVAMEADERIHGGPRETARHMYGAIATFLTAQPGYHVQRLWNYLGDINKGDGDDERYKLFCQGRADGMGAMFSGDFPAATAIGHRADRHVMQVYLLAGMAPGRRIENPRQVSAWEYPRQYGPTPPSFSRATLLGQGDMLAISGTAAVIGHASAHAGDPLAQLDETLTNLDALLASAGIGPGFNADSPLKIYLRHREDFRQIGGVLEQCLPGVPKLYLLGDICRSELLLEIDGWRHVADAAVPP
jgi:chorismate lyase/3-hydroxybenzoate synthase